MAPDACPHMGASLEECRVRDGQARLPVARAGPGEGTEHGRWKPHAVHDDGVLAWVRDRARRTPRRRSRCSRRGPRSSWRASVRLEARCEPEDVIANRLDPWHGVHFHPYSFAALTVRRLRRRRAEGAGAPSVLVGRLCAETDATFHSPEPRTIVMTIVEERAAGSVVETHATPIEPGRTAIVEATLATSDREGVPPCGEAGPSHPALDRALRPAPVGRRRRLR
ncbi:MAG: DUF5914 domain-containing protein [Comamonadaceae bacterium]|nr:DUF5914 domain-containing protein [Comamonadaceae bacterium]